MVLSVVPSLSGHSGLGVVLSSLGVTDFESVIRDGKPSHIREIVLGLADLPQARIISLPGNGRGTKAQ